MVNPDREELYALQRAEAEKRAKRYGVAAEILTQARRENDTAVLRRAQALSFGGLVEHRMNVADALQVIPPPDALEHFFQFLHEALLLDDTIPDIHWDIAVLHGRYTGDFEAAASALDRALDCGIQHPRLTALATLIDAQQTPASPKLTPASELRGLLFKLIDVTADGNIPEYGLPASPPLSFADYVRSAQEIAHADHFVSNPETFDLVSRFRASRDAGLVTADALDFGLEFVFRAAEASPDKRAAEEALNDLVAFLREFSFHVSDGDADASDMRKAARIAKRGLNIVEGTAIPPNPDLYADLWLAFGQASARPARLELHDALTAYTKALRLKREANNEPDTARLRELLFQMLDYAVQLGVGAGIGIGSLGEANKALEAAFAAAQEIGEFRKTLHIGIQYNTLSSALSQPYLAIGVLDQLLAEPEISPDEQLTVLLERAMRYSEARDLPKAAELHADLVSRVASVSKQSQSVFWNSYSNVLRDLGQLERALEAIDRAVALTLEVEANGIDQIGTMLHANRGSILLALGRIDDARHEVEIAVKLNSNLPIGDGSIRIGSLRTRIALKEENFEEALSYCDQAIDQLYHRITVGEADPVVWQSMLQEWSRLDGFGVEARIKSGVPAAQTLAFAEAAKGRLSRLLQKGHGGEARPGLMADAMTPAVEVALSWVGSAPGRRVLSIFCSSNGIAVFSIQGEDADIEAHWLGGPIYENFREEAFKTWENVDVWSLDQGVKRALVQSGAPPELLLMAAESISHLILDQVGSLLGRLAPGLCDGGSELVIVPHRLLRALPIAHARLLGGAYVSELFDEIAVASTLDDFSSVAMDTSHRTAGPADMDLFLDPQDNLPFARLEGVFVENGRVLTGWQATKREFRRSVATADHILVSAHGEFVSENPWSSSIEFNDGPLHISELFEEKSAACSLLILSCCEAGVSQQSNSDEPFGFPAILQAAGVSGLIAPSWRVDDLATFLLITRLQQELATGSAPAKALAQTCHWLRKLTAHETLERLKTLQMRVDTASADAATEHAISSIDMQCQWLDQAYAGHERPFRAPLFWAGFQYFGAPSSAHVTNEGENQ
ncbi:CHAT domain-containing protein [Ruegeria hyattellae]|uniref:CHAT domain-containing protein n=1 Tax=Ruegeria hyattellae TaxID=3233337 RepID=UPI00355AE75F